MNQKWKKLLAAGLIAAQLLVPVLAAETPTVPDATEETQASTEETQLPTEETQAPTEETQAPTEETQGPTEPPKPEPVITADGHVLAEPELLEQFTFPKNWSRNALEFCVANRLMQGRGHSLAEKEDTTRAEMATLLVRIMNLEDRADLSRFRDVSQKDWFYDAMSAAVAAGIVNGTGPDTLSPNDPITREQVAAMMSRAFALAPEDPDRCDDFSDDYAIHGYARAAVSALTERDFLHGYEDGSLRPGANITRAEIAQMLYNLFTCIADTEQELQPDGRVLYRGAGALTDYVLDGSLTVAGSAAVEGGSISGELFLRGRDNTVSDCAVQTVSVGIQSRLQGNVRPETLFLAGKNAAADCDAETVYAYGNTTLGGTYKTVRAMEKNMTLTLNGTADTAELRAHGVRLTGSGSAASVDLYGRRCKVEIKGAAVHDYAPTAEEEALKTVETMEVWDTVLRDTALYSHENLTGYLRSIPAGTKLEHYYVNEGAVSASVYTADGRFGYVPLKDIAIPTDYPLRVERYSREILEGYVNGKGLSSPTQYLIWVNLKTQTTNIFTGSRGNWKLDRSVLCCTGKNSTPTVRGTFDVEYKYWEWNFGDYKVRNVTGFYEGYAFHSVTYTPDYSRVIDGTIGHPASHGCVRMLDEDCGFIHRNIPYGTTVHVF